MIDGTPRQPKGFTWLSYPRKPSSFIAQAFVGVVSNVLQDDHRKSCDHPQRKATDGRYDCSQIGSRQTSADVWLQPPPEANLNADAAKAVVANAQSAKAGPDAKSNAVAAKAVPANALSENAAIYARQRFPLVPAPMTATPFICATLAVTCAITEPMEPTTFPPMLPVTLPTEPDRLPVMLPVRLNVCVPVSWRVAVAQHAVPISVPKSVAVAAPVKTLAAIAPTDASMRPDTRAAGIRASSVVPVSTRMAATSVATSPNEPATT